MKKLLLFTAFMLCAVGAHAQKTTVSATVQDPNGIPYSNARLSGKLVGITGTPKVGQQLIPGTFGPVTLNLLGQFSVSVFSNTAITPINSQWQIQVCEIPGVAPPLGPGQVCFTAPPITITGASQSITTQLNAAAGSLISFSIGGGSGTVNPGTAPQAAYYAASGTAVSPFPGLTFDPVNQITFVQMKAGQSSDPFQLVDSSSSYKGSIDPAGILHFPVFQTTDTNRAAAGTVRLAHTNTVSWRDQAGTGDLALSVDASDALLFKGAALGYGTIGGTVSSPFVPYATGANTLADMAQVKWDAGNNALLVGVDDASLYFPGVIGGATKLQIRTLNASVAIQTEAQGGAGAGSVSNVEFFNVLAPGPNGSAMLGVTSNNVSFSDVAETTGTTTGFKFLVVNAGTGNLGTIIAYEMLAPIGTVTGTITGYHVPGLGGLSAAGSTALAIDDQGTGAADYAINIAGGKSVLSFTGIGAVPGAALALDVEGGATLSPTVYSPVGGAGPNDATFQGTPTQFANFFVAIDGNGTPDTFTWAKDFGTVASGVPITGAAQTLSNGVTVTFGATTGHTIGNQWSSQATTGGYSRTKGGLGIGAIPVNGVDLDVTTSAPYGGVARIGGLTASKCVGTNSTKILTSSADPCPVSITNYPSNVGSDVKAAQVTALGPTTLLTTGGSDAGYYVSATINCTTTSAAATVNISIGWTDTGSQAQSQTLGSAIVCTTLGAASVGGFVYPFSAKTGTTITYTTSIANTPTYDLRVTVYQTTSN